MKLGFIGTGKIATALVRGILHAQICNVEDLRTSGRSQASCEEFGSTFQLELSKNLFIQNNEAVVTQSDIIFICVKPHDCISVLQNLGSKLQGKLVVSMAAGISLSELQIAAGLGISIIRVITNTSVWVGQGMSAYVATSNSTPEQIAAVEKIFSSVGQIVSVEEKYLDALNAISGSGPAYMYLVIEALSDGGVGMGLPRDLAQQFAIQTMIGAGEMALQTQEHPAVLREAITSPGGTTIAALNVLEQKAVRSAFIEAVHAATQRAKSIKK